MGKQEDDLDIISTFDINRREYNKLTKWLKKHVKTCKTRKNSLLTYCFQPTGIGNIIKVKCDCGEEVNLTDVSLW